MVSFTIWALLPWDESLFEGHVAALLLLELLHRNPGAATWATQIAECPIVIDDLRGDPKKGGNILCPLTGYKSKACLNITPLKTTTCFSYKAIVPLNLICAEENSVSGLWEQWCVLIEICHSSNRWEVQKCFPGVLKTYQPSSSGSKSCWREKLLQVVDYQGDLQLWIESARQMFPCSRVGKMKSAV